MSELEKLKTELEQQNEVIRQLKDLVIYLEEQNSGIKFESVEVLEFKHSSVSEWRIE